MTEKKKRNIRYAALVKFAAMLCMSILLLGGLLLCEKETLLAKVETTELTLTKRKETDSTAFQVNNLLPGDAETKDYCVKVACEDSATVYFRVDIKKGYDKLAEALKCRVVLTDTGETLYDGLMKDLSETVSRGMPAEVKDGEELLYQITAYLDTSIGNEYQNTSLKADFVWWLEVAEQRIEITSLTIVPEGLKNTKFNTVEKIKSELSRVLISAGGSEYDIDNMEFYDVRLQFWNGREWIDATEDNFPLEGIKVTLPYPDGTDRNTHDFIVSHMFTVDSDRLGIKAGDVEYPPVTKIADGLQVTFKGLSPVAIAWKELKTEEKVPDTSTEGDTLIGNISANDTDTGDSTNMTLWIVMTVCTATVMIAMAILKKQKVRAQGMRSITQKRIFKSSCLVIIFLTALAVSTVALWYSSVAVEENTFQTGTLSINLNDGSPVITEEDFLFEPGATIVKEFFIENESTTEVYYRIYFEKLDGVLLDVLEVSIQDGDDIIYNGGATGLTRENAAISKEALSIGEKVWLSAVFHLPEDAGNAAQEEALYFDLCADAVQTKNNPDKLFD